MWAMEPSGFMYDHWPGTTWPSTVTKICESAYVPRVLFWKVIGKLPGPP